MQCEGFREREQHESQHMVQAGSHDRPYSIYSSFPLVLERLALQILLVVIPTSKFLADPFAMCRRFTFSAIESVKIQDSMNQRIPNVKAAYHTFTMNTIHNIRLLHMKMKEN